MSPWNNLSELVRHHEDSQGRRSGEGERDLNTRISSKKKADSGGQELSCRPLACPGDLRLRSSSPPMLSPPGRPCAAPAQTNCKYTSAAISFHAPPTHSAHSLGCLLSCVETSPTSGPPVGCRVSQRHLHHAGRHVASLFVHVQCHSQCSLHFLSTT